MLPCQKDCRRYCPGCHRDCQKWKEFRQEQETQRQMKKRYLSYYVELCADRTRQFRKLAPLKW